MNPAKRNYLTRIRAESAYPTYRSLVNILAWFCFIAGGLIILGGAIAALAAISQGRFEGVGVALAAALAGGGYIVLGLFLRETAFIVADIADSITDYNSRHESTAPSHTTFPQKCPKCGLVNPPGSISCDCGYKFVATPAT